MKSRRALLGGAGLSAACLLGAGGFAMGADAPLGELRIGTADARLVLVVPTGWVAFADDDGSGALSDAEVRAHAAELSARLGTRVWLSADGERAALTVAPSDTPPPRLDLATDGQHAVLALDFRWPRPVGAIALHYGLFTPGEPGAMAELAVTRDGATVPLAFTPDHPEQPFDGRTPSHRFAMALGLLGNARGLMGLGALLVLLGLAYAAWMLARGLKPPDEGEQAP